MRNAIVDHSIVVEYEVRKRGGGRHRGSTRHCSYVNFNPFGREAEGWDGSGRAIGFVHEIWPEMEGRGMRRFLLQLRCKLRTLLFARRLRGAVHTSNDTYHARLAAMGISARSTAMFTNIEAAEISRMPAARTCILFGSQHAGEEEVLATVESMRVGILLKKKGRRGLLKPLQIVRTREEDLAVTTNPLEMLPKSSSSAFLLNSFGRLAVIGRTYLAGSRGKGLLMLRRK